MSFRARLAALIFGAAAPARDVRAPRVASTVSDGRILPEHQAKLIRKGRDAVEVLTRTRIERSCHFTPPRFS